MGIAIDQKLQRQLLHNKFDLALQLHQSGRLADAKHLYEEILAECPDHFNALHLIGLVELQSYQPTLALPLFDRALKLNSNHAPLHSNRGLALKDLQRFDEALSSYDSALAIDVTLSDAHYNRGVVNLALGNFREGWSDYERRAEIGSLYQTSLKGHAEFGEGFAVRNRVEDLRGKAIFVASEQGLGDCIMFYSILPDLLRDAGHVICQADKRLLGLLRRCFPAITFVQSGDFAILKSTRIDRYIRLASLGFTYRQDRKDFPGTAYLRSDPALRSRWAARLSSDPTLINIGISWRGGTKNTNGNGRSIALEQLKPLIDRPDCRFVSLQYGEVESEIDELNASLTQKLTYFPKSETDDFENFSGLISALNCVISIDNTTVHLCGALGKRCLTLLPFRPQWRYGASGSKMPWYSSIELYRQASNGLWSELIDTVSDRLNTWSVLPEATDEASEVESLVCPHEVVQFEC